jgi:hypothetical protein
MRVSASSMVFDRGKNVLCCEGGVGAERCDLLLPPCDGSSVFGM